MAVLKASRTAQYVLQQEFTFNFNDTAVDTVAGTSKTFGSVVADALVFDAIPLPPNANVVGGELIVETAYDTGTTATISVGDSASATRYLGATSLKSAARTALTLTGYRGAGENIRLTFAHAGTVPTVGKATVRVQYTIQGRANESQIT